MPTVIDLGQKVKMKYPGQYDDLSDLEVGQKVKSKYPSEYSDFEDQPTIFKYNTSPVQQTKPSLQQLQQESEIANKKAKQANSFSGILGNTLKGVGETLVSSEIGLGKTIGKIGGAKYLDTYNKNIETLNNSQIQLQKLIKDHEAKGINADNLKRAYNDNQDLIEKNKSEISQYNKELPTTGQALGQIGGTALDVLTAGVYGKSAQGMKTGALAKSTVPFAKKATTAVGLPELGKIAEQKAGGLFTKKGALNIAKGAGIGYASDVTLGLQGYRGEDRTGGNAFIPGLGTAIGTSIPVISEGYQTYKNVFHPSQEIKQKAINELEQSYSDWQSGTTAGKKKLSKIQQKTEALNRAGTEGKTPQRTLAESGIIPNRAGTKLDTFEQAQQYREAIKPLREANRQALIETGMATELNDLNSLEQKAINQAKSPQNVNAGRFESMKNEITKRFDALRRAYPEGKVPLTVVDDIKSAHWDNVFGNKSLVESDKLVKDADYSIAKALQKHIEETANKAGATEVAQLNREIGDRLDASKFLEDLNGKTIKGGRLLKYVTTAIGAGVGNTLPGKVIGALGGNMVGELIISNNVATPTKRLLLKHLEQTDPEAYTKTIQWLEKQGLDRELRLLLPAPTGKETYINQGRPIPVLPKRFKGDYVGGETVVRNYEKSPAAQQTIPAITNESNIPISKTVPQETWLGQGKRELGQIGEALKDQGGYIKNPLAKKPIESETMQVLRGTKGLTKKDIETPLANIKTKTTLPAKDVYGNKVQIPEGEVLTPYPVKGKNQMLLQDGEAYLVDKNQFQNIKGQSIGGEAKPFAPELKGLEETVNGGGDWKSFIDEIQKKNNVNHLYGIENTKKLMTPEELNKYNQFSKNTKYSQYTLPDGKNYKEILIKAPEQKLPEKYTKFEDYRQELIKKYGDDFYNAKLTKKEASKLRTLKRFSQKYNELYLPENKAKLKEAEDKIRQQTFKSSHWDEPNVISHIRMNERTYNGKKVAFMEELQSDWAREGRNKGFAKKLTIDDAKQQGFVVYKKPTNMGGEAYFVDNPTDPYMYRKGFPNHGFATEADAWNAITKKLQDTSSSVPNNPNLKNWQELSVKRALKEAVDNDADYFAWINGEQTSARYNLATQLDNIEWANRNGKKMITIKPLDKSTFRFGIDKDGTITNEIGTPPAGWNRRKLDEVLGKGLADKIMEKESGTLSGEGLKFGGEWANNLYDKQVKNIVEDLTGGKVEMMDMGLPIEKKADRAYWIDSLKNNSGEHFFATRNGDRFTIVEEVNSGGNKAYKVYKNNKTLGTNPRFRTVEKAKEFAESYMDISNPTTVQQGIKLTPEIKAKIRGEAIKLKNSGKMYVLPPRK